VLTTDQRPSGGFFYHARVDPEVVDAVWAGCEPLLPTLVDTHPLGCHRPRAQDRDCFEVILVRLATGCSWEDAERLCARKVSDTTVRARRDEWIAAGVFDKLCTEALAGYEIIGLDLSDVASTGRSTRVLVGAREPGRTQPTEASSAGSGPF